MNRIETRIVMMVTNRLSAAKDSDAKMELIEELSENLYQRYLELSAEGKPEEEALKTALESLGDVNELLAYLEDEDGAAQEPDSQPGGGTQSSFESGLEDMINMALSTAKAAVDYGKDIARDVSEQIREKCPDKVFVFTSEKSRRVDCTSIPSEGIQSLEVHLTNGDIALDFSEDPAQPIEISGDTEEIESILREDGVLSVKQGNTASSSFFFNRSMRATDIRILLPRRPWDKISITTVNGDIQIEHAGLECNGLAVQTTSGDLRLSEVTSGRLAFRTASGDVCGRSLNGDVYAETKSGDVEVTDGRLGRLAVSSASGDIRFEGKCQEANCSTLSGDIQMMPYTLPEKIKASSKSGDCEIKVPEGEGFRLIYRTVSGEFAANLPLTLASLQKGKSGEAIYLDGGHSEIQMSTISGDLEIRG